MSEQAVKPRVSFDRHEDDEWYDEVHVTVRERWKESELSGDEWRFSYVAEFKRKGEVHKTLTAHKLEWLLPKIAAHQSFAPAGDDEGAPKDDHERCFQPGCTALATVEYRKRKDWCSRCGQSHEADWQDQRRRFCDKHLRRGDCGLDDADANYEEVAFRGPDGEWLPIAPSSGQCAGGGS